VYTDEELTRCKEPGCKNGGVPPDYTMCIECYNELIVLNTKVKKKKEPTLVWPNVVRVKLIEEIMKNADFLTSEGSPEEAKGVYYVGQYLKIGMWPWEAE